MKEEEEKNKKWRWEQGWGSFFFVNDFIFILFFKYFFQLFIKQK